MSDFEIVYRFGDFELDEGCFQLRLRGEVVPVEPKIFDFLRFLLRNRGRVVTKDELLETLWPDQRVSDGSLLRVVSLARQALRAGETNRIETIRSRGYRFVGEVGEEPSSEPARGTQSDSAEILGEGLDREAFVGREEELRHLKAGLVDAMDGAGRLFLVTGEPGIGKTRLAAEFGSHAKQRNARVRWGRCHESEGAPAYWPWLQVLRSEVEERTPEELADWAGQGAPEIAAMVGELHQKLPDLPRPPELAPNQARFRLFDSITGFFKRASREHPLVIVLDDLHRADPPSLLLLRFLAAELIDTRIVLLGTYRDAALRGDSRAALLADLSRQSGARTLQLGGLSGPDIAQLVEAVTGRQPHESIGSSLRIHTAGNPFFVNQVANLFNAQSTPMAEETTPEFMRSLPPSLREAVVRQLQDLPDSSRELLSLASVIGREFSLAALALASGKPSEELLECLIPAVEARVVAEQRESRGVYRFSHVLVRNALYEELDPARRSSQHERIAKVLSRLHAAEPGPYEAEVAYHFSQAGTECSDRTLLHTLKAADWSAEQLAHEEAARHYGDALERLPASAPNAVRRADLLLALGEAQVRSGDRENATATLRRAADAASQLGAAERLSHAALGLAPGFLSLHSGTYDSVVVELLERAERSLPESSAALRSRVLGRLAMALYWSDEEERRARLCEESIRLAGESGDPGAVAFAQGSRLVAFWGPENLEERLARAPEIARQTRANERELSLVYRAIEIVSLMESGDLNAVDRATATYNRDAEELRQPQARWLAACFRGVRAIADARFAEAEDLAEGYWPQAVRADDMPASQNLGALLAVVRWERGNIQDVMSSLSSFANQLPGHPVWGCGKAWALSELGVNPQAKDEFDRIAAHDFSDLPTDSAWMICVAALAQACFEHKDVSRAGRLYELLEPYAERDVVIGFGTFSWGPVRRTLGLLAAVMSRWDESDHHFEAALARNRTFGATGWLIRTQFDFARALLERPEPALGRAKELAASALEAAVPLGMAAQAQKLRELLDRTAS